MHRNAIKYTISIDSKDILISTKCDLQMHVAYVLIRPFLITNYLLLEVNERPNVPSES